MTKEKIIEEMKQCLQAIELYEKVYLEDDVAWRWCENIIKKAKELQKFYKPTQYGLDFKETLW